MNRRNFIKNGLAAVVSVWGASVVYGTHSLELVAAEISKGVVVDVNVLLTPVAIANEALRILGQELVFNSLMYEKENKEAVKGMNVMIWKWQTPRYV